MKRLSELQESQQQHAELQGEQLEESVEMDRNNYQYNENPNKEVVINSNNNFLNNRNSSTKRNKKDDDEDFDEFGDEMLPMW